MKNLFLTVLLAAVSSLQATTLNFSCLTDNGNNCASMVGQLSVDVTDPGSGQVLFTFLNAGPVASNISEIYWDDNDSDPVLLSFVGFDPFGPGVDFSNGASPANLPSAGTAVPPFDADHAVSANPPPAANGVGPTESLGVYFDLVGGMTFADVVTALEDGSLRIGMHVTGIGTVGGSDAVLNIAPLPPAPNIPEPSTYVLMGAGLLALGVLRNRRK